MAKIVECGKICLMGLNPLLPPDSEIDTRSLDFWLETRDKLPQDLRALDYITTGERKTIMGNSGTLSYDAREQAQNALQR